MFDNNCSAHDKSFSGKNSKQKFWKSSIDQAKAVFSLLQISFATFYRILFYLESELLTYDVHICVYKRGVAKANRLVHFRLKRFTILNLGRGW